MLIQTFLYRNLFNIKISRKLNSIYKFSKNHLLKYKSKNRKKSKINLHRIPVTALKLDCNVTTFKIPKVSLWPHNTPEALGAVNKFRNP